MSDSGNPRSRRPTSLLLVTLFAMGCAANGAPQIESDASATGCTGVDCASSATKPRAQCLSDSALPAERRDALSSYARRILSLAVAGSAKALVTEAGELAPADTEKHFRYIARGLYALIDDVATVPVESVHELRATRDYVGVVPCPSPDSAGTGLVVRVDHPTVSFKTDATDFAFGYVTFITGSEGFAQRIIVNTASEAGSKQLHLAGIGRQLYSIDGRDSEYFFEMAEKYPFDEEPATHAASLMMAMHLAQVDRAATTTAGARASKLAERLPADADVHILHSSPSEFSVLGISIVAGRPVPDAGETLYLLVQYLTSDPLTEKTLRRDSDVLMERIQQKNPHIGDVIPGILFSAFNEIPKIAERHYPNTSLYRRIGP